MRPSLYYLQFLRPLKGLLTHGTLELSLALMVVVYVAPQCPRIRRHLTANGTAMLARALHVNALHVLLESCHALKPGPADLALLQLGLRARFVRMHQFLVLFQNDFSAHLFSALVADDRTFRVVHRTHVVLQLALSEESSP